MSIAVNQVISIHAFYKTLAKDGTTKTGCVPVQDK